MDLRNFQGLEKEGNLNQLPSLTFSATPTKGPISSFTIQQT